MAGAVRARAARTAGPAHPGRTVVLALLLVLVVLLVLLLTDVLERGSDDGAAGPGLSVDAYRDVVLGVDREALTERLLPVRPVEGVAPTGGDDLPPPPGGTRCIYYAASVDGSGYYRFCFADDRLVDKAVVQPDE